MLIKLTNNEVAYCKSCAKNMWSSSKRGTYGKGLINTKKDPYRVEFIGIAGEFAFSKMMGIPYKYEYKHGGDTEDFFLKKKKINIKTSARNYGKGLIIYRDGNHLYSLAQDIYVFGVLEKENQVRFIGWTTKEFIKTCPIKQSWLKNATHYNYVIDFKNLNKKWNL